MYMHIYIYIYKQKKKQDYETRNLKIVKDCEVSTYFNVQVKY